MSDPQVTRPPVWSSISARMALLIVVLMTISAVVTALFIAVSVRGTAAETTDEAVANFHAATAMAIDQKSEDLGRYRTQALAARKQRLKEVTAAQVGALSRLNAAVDAGEISLANAQAQAKDLLDTFRYGDGDYFFAFTPDMDSIVEPNPTFRGHMLDYRDPNGKQFFREFQSVALGPGEGFVDYVGTRVGSAAPAAKVSFIEYFKPWQWVVGTGVYLDDIDKDAAAQLQQAKEDLSTALDVERIANTGFFYLLGSDGSVIAAPHDRQQLLASAQTRPLTEQLIATAEAHPTGIMKVQAEANLNGVSEPWEFNVSTSPGQQWILVSAVPSNQLARVANDLVRRLLIISVLVLVLGVGLGVLLSRRIVRPLAQVTAAAVDLERDHFEPDSLTAAAARRDEVGVLARAFRRMGSEVMERERVLRSRVQRLQVVVDKTKVEDDISAITESDFFQRLEQQAEEIRNRE